MQGFQGYGYSDSFAANMGRVIKDINSHSDGELEIISECDVICSACPHNKNGLCKKNPDSAQKIKEMDGKVLQKLELKENQKINLDNILSLIKTKLKKSDIEDICAECGWRSKCLFAESYENL
jgi:hypothetical protein